MSLKHHLSGAHVGIVAALTKVYYGQLGINEKCPDYQGVLIFRVILYDKMPFRTSNKCVDYTGCPHFSSVHINRFHSKCRSQYSLFAIELLDSNTITY